MDNANEFYDANLRPIPVAGGLWALLVCHEEKPLQGLQRILLDLGMTTRRVRNYSASRAALQNPPRPALVLTDTSLPDGSWADVIEVTRAVAPSPPVIVVSRLVDIKLYLDVMESGAYDFVVPPLTSADVAYLVSGALLRSSFHSPGKPGQDSSPSSLRRMSSSFEANR